MKAVHALSPNDLKTTVVICLPTLANWQLARDVVSKSVGVGVRVGFRPQLAEQTCMCDSPIPSPAPPLCRRNICAHFTQPTPLWGFAWESGLHYDDASLVLGRQLDKSSTTTTTLHGSLQLHVIVWQSARSSQGGWRLSGFIILKLKCLWSCTLCSSLSPLQLQLMSFLLLFACVCVHRLLAVSVADALLCFGARYAFALLFSFSFSFGVARRQMCTYTFLID